MSYKTRTIAFFGVLIIISEVIAVTIAGNFPNFGALPFIIWIPFVLVCYILVRRFRMDPTKSFVLIGPTNSFGYTYVPFVWGMEFSAKQMARFQKVSKKFSQKITARTSRISQPFGKQQLFVKQHKVPSHIQCLMCNMEMFTRDSKFYTIYDRQLDDFEAYIHEECIDQYSKVHKKDIKRDLTAVHLKEHVQRSEQYTNLVHLINLGTERRFDLHLIHSEPKFFSVFPYDISPSQSYKPEYYTYVS